MMKSSYFERHAQNVFLHYMLSVHQLVHVCVKCFLLLLQVVFIVLIWFQNTLISIRFPTWLAFGIEVDLFFLWVWFVVHVYGCCLMDCSMYNRKLSNVYTKQLQLLQLVLPCFQCQSRQWLVFVILYWMGSTCFISIAHFVFPCFTADWTFPTVTGDIPPPMDDFSFTKVSNKQAALFGGYGPGYIKYSDLRLATVSKDSVVSVMIIAPCLSFSYFLFELIMAVYTGTSQSVLA